MLPYLRLLRLPNVFTALADIAMGYALARRTAEPVGLLAILLAASGCLYLAGMVLNDVFDLEVDRRERPQRPLPSGAVSFGFARLLGFGLLALGLLFGGAAGFAFPNVVGLPWRTGMTAAALALAILSYNGVLKQTWLGPLNMGLCRFLNVLLGASVGGSVLLGVPGGESSAQWFAWSPMVLCAAAGVGTYIVGITIIAKKEAEESASTMLVLGTAVLVAGLVLLGASALFADAPLRCRPEFFWLLIALLSVTVVRLCLTAVFEPTPKNVQQAVKRGILSLILYDAAVCLTVAPNWYAIAVVALLIPALLLGRWIYST